MPRKITTKTGMSAAEGGFWLLAVVFSCGLAYPAYRLRKHQLDRTSRTVIE